MISIVICSVDSAKFAAVCAQYRLAMGAEPFEFIGIHDAKSLCEGYRRGLAASRGELVIFSHDDVEIWSPDFAPRLKKHMETYDGIGVAGANRVVAPGWVQAGVPYVFGHIVHRKPEGSHIVEIYGMPRLVVGGIRAMDGVFMAFRREVIERVGWDAEVFDGFHLYDVDCSYRAYQAGYKLAVALDLTILHQSGGKFDNKWEQYAAKFIKKHAATFDKMAPQKCHWAAVLVQRKEDALQIIADMRAQFASVE